MCCMPFCSSALFFTLFFQRVYGFAFAASQPSQCGELRFDWVGGTPPFTALIIVPFGITRNVSIPAQSWNEQDQSGDFSYLLPLNQSQKVVFSMGDATGPTAGGVTDVNTVETPADGSPPCDTSSPSTDFTFETDLLLLQCKDYSFGQFGTAVQPISVLVTVPHGQSFTLIAPPGDPFLWKANLTVGTSVMFTVKDAQNRVGGTSQLLSVGASDDSSCLGPAPVSASPTRLPQTSTTSSPNPSLTNTPNPPSSGSGSRSKDKQTDNKTAIIIGSSVGGSVGLLVIVTLIFCLARRKGQRDGAKPGSDLHGPAPGVSTSFLPPGQAQYSDQVPSTPYSVNPNVGAQPTSQSNGFSPVPMKVTPAPYPSNPNGVVPRSRGNGFPCGQMQYYDQVASTPHFFNPNAGTQPASQSDGFPLGLSTPTSIGNGPTMSPSTAAAMLAVAETEVSAGTMDPKANHSAMSFKREAVQPKKGERHLYFDPYARNWPQQDYDLDQHADASSSSQKIENMSGFGAGTAFNTGASTGDGEATLSPQIRKSLLASSSFTTHPPWHLKVRTDMEDELPPVYSDLRSAIPPLPSAAPTGNEC